VRVEVYANSTLYKDKEELEALQLGAVQMLAPSLAKFGQLGLRDFEVFDLPFLFPNRQAVQNVVQSAIGKSLLKQLEPRGIVGLAFWDNGFKVMAANVPPNNPLTLKGKRIRIQPSRVIEKQIELLGATPIALPFSETYAALSSGLVDGTENTPSNLHSQRIHELLKYIAITNHSYLGYAVVVNQKFWRSLPKDIRGILEDCMEQATLKNQTMADQLNQQALATIQKLGKTEVRILSPMERDAWRKVLEPVYQDTEKRLNNGLVTKTRKAAGSQTSMLRPYFQ
jgi:C4-dicarboxylate-binding protein DctP